jgi:dihydroneopterin aldolase
MADRILVQDLTFYAYHGVDVDEQHIGGRFRVSAALTLDLLPAGRSDNLADTVSYAEVCRTIAQIGTEQRFRLIEAVAEAIAAELLARYPVDAVTVRVTKEHPPVPQLLQGSAAVEITRRRKGHDPVPQQEGQPWS